MKGTVNNLTYEIVVGQKVRWFQPGLNRWLSGTIVELDESSELAQKNTNETKVTVQLESGKLVKTIALFIGKKLV